jgi:hypothetical protein
MSKLDFKALRANYPYPEKLSHDKLFEELGWDSLKEDKGYESTCAIRMSYCLIQAGLDIKGRLKILKGPHKGKMIEPGQKALTSKMSTYLGFAPQTLKRNQEKSFIVDRKKGVIAFTDIEGYRDTSGNSSGHIDLVWTEKNSLTVFGWEVWSSSESECGTHCYWDSAKEILFWELK